MLTNGKNQNCIVILNIRSVHHQLQHTPLVALIVFNSLVDRSLWHVVPNQLKCLLELMSLVIAFG